MRLRLLALAISFSNRGPQTPHQLTRFRPFATTAAAATAESRPHRRYSGEMDSHAPAPSGDCGGTWWTDEKHLHFLDSLESSFLRAMLVRRSNRPVLRLDRHLPDSSDSTSDSALPRTRKRRTSRDICRLGGPAAKKPRHSRRSCNLPCDDDQVVPQIAKRAADEEEEDPTNVQASQARPT